MYLLTSFCNTSSVIQSVMRQNASVIMTIGMVLGVFQLAQSQADTFSLDESKMHFLEGITISEQRFDSGLRQLSRSAVLLPKKDLVELPVQSVHQVLSFQPGIDIRQRGVHGVQADLGIRGSSFDQTLLLLNGIKMTDPQTGHHLMNIPISPIGLDRIEIFKSSAARHYGTNAFAGVINLITTPADEFNLRGDVYGADFNSFGTDVIVDLPIKEYRQQVSLGYHQSDGYRYNSDYIIGQGTYLGQWRAWGGQFDVQLAYSDRSFGANGFYASEQFTDQWERVQTGLASITYQVSKNRLRHRAAAYQRYGWDNYLLVRSDPSIFENIHQTQVTGLEYNVTLTSEWGETGVGSEIRNEYINSTNLGEHNRVIAGVFLEHRYQWRQLGVSPGVYMNYFSDADVQWYPGLELHYELNESKTIYANTSRSFRLPTYTDLFYIGPTNVGNPDLNPESAWNYEIGLRHLSQGHAFEVNLWRRNTNNLIDWVRVDDNEPWQPVNFINVNMTGTDVMYKISFDSRHDFILSNVVKQLQVGYSFIHAEFDVSDGFLSRYALNNLRHQINSTIQLSYGKRFQHTISVRYADRVSIEDFTVFDTRLFYTINVGRLYLEVNNILNAVYRETDLVPMPGRWAKVGFQFAMK